MIEDSELLCRYAEDRSESAFAELVRRHIGFVYAAALRQLGGATHRAEEVTQIVFIALASKSRVLSGRGQLAGWLYTSTHYACAKMKRAEQRRQKRELDAFTMKETLLNVDPSADWERLRPVLDDAMLELNHDDRTVILMRFFQGCRYAELGQEFGLSDDAARMRVERALGKLRVLLARKRITSTSAALSLVLANQPAVAVPVTLAAAITSAALSTTTFGIGSAITIYLMKIKTAIAAIAAVSAVALATYELREVKIARADAAAFANERDVMRIQLREMQQHVSATEARLAELQRQAQMRTIQNATPFAMPPSGGGSNTSSSDGGTYTLRSMTPDQVRALNGQNVDTTYAALYRQLGWKDTQRDQFRNLMLDRKESGDRLFKSAVAAAKAQDPKLDRAGMFEVLEATNMQTQVEQQADVGRVFGEAASKALGNYQETLPMRAIANQLATALFNSEAPITPAQSDQLAEILAHNARGPIGKVEIAALDTDTAVAQVEAAGLLNRTQAEELRRVAVRMKEQSIAERARNTAPTASLKLIQK